MHVEYLGIHLERMKEMMKDKLKGLFLGLSLGTILTGSIAYASGTQIEVYFSSLKYMFDGVEKKPTAEQGDGFIYNGTTYVPLRFVSESLGKEVQWDSDTGTIWVGKKTDLESVVATFKGGQIKLGEFNAYLAVNRLFNANNAQLEKQQGYKESLLRQLIAYRVLESRSSDEIKASLPDLIEKQFEQVKQALLARSSESDFSAMLAKEGLTEQDLRKHIGLVICGSKTLLESVSEDKLKSAYNDRLAANSGEFVYASVRHILISSSDADGKKRSKDEVNKKVREVQDRLKKGEDFATLAKQYSEDPGSKDNGGLYENAPVSNWIQPFKEAAMKLDLNKVSDPVETDYGYHIIRVESRRTLSFDEVKEQLRGQLANQQYNELMNQELPTLIEKMDVPKS